MTNDKIGRRRPISRSDFNVKLKKGEKKRVIDATIKLFFPPRVEIMSLVNLVYQFRRANFQRPTWLFPPKFFPPIRRENHKTRESGNSILARSCSCDEQATDKYTGRIPSKFEGRKEEEGEARKGATCQLAPFESRRP